MLLEVESTELYPVYELRPRGQRPYSPDWVVDAPEELIREYNAACAAFREVQERIRRLVEGDGATDTLRWTVQDMQPVPCP